MAPVDYIRDPNEIYRRSFEAVAVETDISGIPPEGVPLTHRIVHACGMPEITRDLRMTNHAITAGRNALHAGAVILADCNMVASGIIRDRLPNDNAIICTLNDARPKPGNTRSAAAVDAWNQHLENAVVAIGNAPTALFRLLEILQDGAPKPAVILGFPVGFVGAAESKEALTLSNLEIDFITLLGRRGGSAIAAAAVNALSSDNVI
ncbi:MAG: precorrin-8X methylmutase [Rhodospirillaceae bacterium]|nr:precorrin-8X methylmutase [Rhodospirillaceae bacterium]